MESKTIIATLKGQVGKLLDDNRMLRAELKKLVAERERIALQKREAEEKILALEKRVRTLETARAFAGSKADNKAARLRVNRLIREIDNCIALMNRYLAARGVDEWDAADPDLTGDGLIDAIIAEKRKIYKGVSANIDFYSGMVYKMLDLPYELFTPIFAVARIAGWSAHRIEEIQNAGKIIRPAYIGVKQEEKYVEISKR